MSSYISHIASEEAAAPQKPPTGDMKVRQAEAKSPLAELPLQTLVGVARGFAYGARKYARGNWYNASLGDGAEPRYLSACMRHLAGMQGPSGLIDSSALDVESGLPHIDHAICSLLMLRGILVKDGKLPLDPGAGNNPKETK